MLKSIIFDFDGVILESVDIKTKAFLQLYENYPLTIQEEVKNYHLKHSGISRYEKIFYFQKYLINEDASKTKINTLANEFKKIVLNQVFICDFVKGSKEFLNLYKHKIDFHIATGTPQDEIEVIIKNKKIEHFFISISGSPASKEEIISNIINKYKYDNCEVLVVGDALTDYKGAMANKVNFIGRVELGTKSPFPKNELIIDDLTMLADTINRLFHRNETTSKKVN